MKKLNRIFIFSLFVLLMISANLLLSSATELSEPVTSEPATTEPATSEPVTSEPAVITPDAPSALAYVSATETSLTVKWTPSDGADRYTVYYGISGEDGYTFAGTATGTTFKVTGLEPAKKYKIKIYAHASEKRSERSDILKLYTAPQRGSRPVKVSCDSASVTVKWAKTPKAKLYDVYVASAKDGKYKKVIATKKTTYTHKKKTPQKAYYFKVVPVIKTADQYSKGQASPIRKASVGKISIELPDVIRKGEYPEITVPYYNSKVKWKSSNKSVIRIKDGRIYAVGQGKAKLTATYNKKYKRTVTVKVSSPTLKYMSAVYDVTDKQYIYQNRINDRCYPASITKLVTALVALKYMDENDTIVVGNELNMVEVYSSRCDIRRGEKYKLRDLLYGLLLPSGGDAAYTIAVNCARKVSGNPNMGYVAAKNYFVGLMNKYIKKIGGTGSHFVNPHGYPVNGHYSTVHDLVLVAKKVLANDTLKKITSTPYKYVKALTGQKHEWATTNSLIASYAYYYSPYAIGMKTGTVNDEYTGIIGAFRKDKHTYITVVIGCESYNARYDATHKLIRTYL